MNENHHHRGYVESSAIQPKWTRDVLWQLGWFKSTNSWCAFRGNNLLWLQLCRCAALQQPSLILTFGCIVSLLYAEDWKVRGICVHPPRYIQVLVFAQLFGYGEPKEVC